MKLIFLVSLYGLDIGDAAEISAAISTLDLNMSLLEMGICAMVVGLTFLLNEKVKGDASCSSSSLYLLRSNYTFSIYTALNSYSSF